MSAIRPYPPSRPITLGPPQPAVVFPKPQNVFGSDALLTPRRMPAGANPNPFGSPPASSAFQAGSSLNVVL